MVISDLNLNIAKVVPMLIAKLNSGFLISYQNIARIIRKVRLEIVIGRIMICCKVSLSMISLMIGFSNNTIVRRISNDIQILVIFSRNRKIFFKCNTVCYRRKFLI